MSDSRSNLYFDYAAATPLDSAVAQRMQDLLTNDFGNPSSTYHFGRQARRHIDESRAKVADILGVGTSEILFTHSGTESNNLALLGAARAAKQGKHIVTTTIEHPSVRGAVHQLEQEGFAVSYVDVDEYGVVDRESLRDCLRSDTVLVSIIAAHNEIGTVQHVRQLADTIHGVREDILFHIDACQYAVYFSLRVEQLGVDLLSFNASKIYGPKGAAVLYKNQAVELRPIVHGGGQEWGYWSGTENVAGIVGLATALERNEACRESEARRVTELREKLWAGLCDLEGVALNGHPQRRLPNNAHVSFSGVDTETFLANLDQAGIAASSGSACQSGAIEPSTTLQAVGKYDPHAAHIRFSLGRPTTAADIDTVLQRIRDIRS